ncbi:MAG: ABC transporter transmembrane domain-containing protein [Planctomycetota bacterium]
MRYADENRFDVRRPDEEGTDYTCRSDMNLQGQYEDARLVITSDEIRSECSGEIEARHDRDEVEYVFITQYVGNGQLEARLKDGREVPLLRFSKTLADQFEEEQEEINSILGGERSQEEKDEQRELAGPTEEKLTYRCPNCGYPLKHQGDVCPKCVSIRSVIWRLVGYLRPYWKETIVGFTLALMLAVLELVPGLILHQLIDGPLRLPEVVPAEESAAAAELSGEDRFASEKAHELAEEHDINVDGLHGTGNRGLVTEEDVREYLSRRELFASPDAQHLAYSNLIHPDQIPDRNEEGVIDREMVNNYVAAVEEKDPTSLARAWAFRLGVNLRDLDRPETGSIGKEEVIAASRPERYRMVAVLVATLLSAFLIRSLIIWGRANIMGSLGAKLMHDLRSHLYRALQRLSLSFYDRQHTGRIMSRVNRDTTMLRNFIVQGLQRVVIHGLTITVLAGVMIWYKWNLALLALLPMPIMAFITYVFSRRVRQLYRRIRRKSANLLKAVKETVSGVRVVKAFAQEDRELESFSQKNLDHLNVTVESVKLKSLFQPSVIFLTALGTLIIFSYGGYMVIAGSLSLGVLVMFNTFMGKLYAPIRQLSQVTDLFQRAAVSAERIFGVIDTPSAVAEPEDARPVENVEGRIEMVDVDFSYEKDEKVLKNINIDVRPGEIIGLVGQTGSGKSTVVKLVARFYDPDSGSVKLDGHDLRQLRLKDLRENMGMVLQDTFLFTGTIKENIAYGRPSAGREDIIEAARAANAHDFIMELPDAYDTYTGERGVGLSGGEKQRVAIARAILKDPAILILDEATSAVDTATEAMIQDALDRLMQDRTTFAIAHRLSTLQNADRLVVLDDGEIAEMGTHDELLAHQDGIYRNLVEIQDLLSQGGRGKRGEVA